jgi:guanine deaminase
MYNAEFMKRAIELSSQALTTPGTEPCGAVVVRDGNIIGEGFNHSKVKFDPTSHGEVEAIRDACLRLECVELNGSDLYTSAEPCALCVAAMSIVGVKKLYYAASLPNTYNIFKNVSADTRYLFDPFVVQEDSGKEPSKGNLKGEQHMEAEAIAVLEKWATEHAR